MEVEYFPAVHSIHSVSPVTILYFPATHCTHSIPSGPVDPALQVQLAKLSLAMGELERTGHASHRSELAAFMVEYLPETQPVQFASPRTFLNVPAVHAMQARPPSGPVNPASHRQSSCEALALEELECAPQL